MTPEANDKSKGLDDTINSLCCDLKPVKCQCPYSRSALWILIAISYTLAISAMVGLRPNFMDKMLDQNFIFEIGLALATGLTATLVTFWLTLPDSNRYNIFLGVPATLFCVHVFWMLDRFLIEGVGATPETWLSNCWMNTALIAGAPAGLAIVLLRSGASVRPLLLAFNAVLAVTSFGWIGIRFTCPYDSVGKAYFINFLPFLVIGLGVGICAKRLFRW